MAKILTVEESAKYFKLAPQTIYDWVQHGEIPGINLGKEWRFKKSMIDQRMEEKINEEFKKYL
jgi:excisionase family DNA binding protein